MTPNADFDSTADAQNNEVTGGGRKSVQESRIAMVRGYWCSTWVTFASWIRIMKWIRKYKLPNSVSSKDNPWSSCIQSRMRRMTTIYTTMKFGTQKHSTISTTPLKMTTMKRWRRPRKSTNGIKSMGIPFCWSFFSVANLFSEQSVNHPPPPNTQLQEPYC